jgi:hypothetical protein
MQPMTEWKLKMAASVVLDLVDLTSAVLPVTGYGAEVVGIPLTMLLWGWRGGLYGIELLDPTNLLDGMVPTATLIGWSRRAEYQQRQREWEARQSVA